MLTLDLDRLLQISAHPCVSVLLATRPGRSLHPADRHALDQLVAVAVERLERELGVERAAALAARLRELAHDAADRPPSEGLALYVADDVAWSTTVAVPVRSRVVVDTTFATRDLIEHDARSEPYWVLVVSERRARLLLGGTERLDELTGGGFPVEADDPARGPANTGDDFLREIARRLDDLVPAAPIVLVGVERTLIRFQSLWGGRTVGRVTGNHDRTPRPGLHRLVWPVVARLRDARQSVALGEVERARSRGRLVTGLPEVWAAALAGRVELLVAERSYEQPVRLVDDQIRPAHDREHPDVIDDAIDDVAEHVLRRGGRAAFVSDERLAADGRIAAVLRY